MTIMNPITVFDNHYTSADVGDLPPPLRLVLTSGRTLAAEREQMMMKSQEATSGTEISLLSKVEQNTNNNVSFAEYLFHRKDQSVAAMAQRQALKPSMGGNVAMNEEGPLIRQTTATTGKSVKEMLNKNKKINNEDDDECHKRIAKIRSIIRKAIEKRLRAKCNDMPCTDPNRQQGCTPKAVASMSLKVEAQLFDARDSLEAYADLATLDARLQSLALVGLNRRLVQQCRLKSKRQRTAQLVQILGGIGRYRQIQTLLQDIRNEQQNLLSNRVLGKCRGCCGGSSDNDDACSIQQQQQPLLCFKDNDMPTPVRDLYFGSQQLANAFEKTPIERLHQVDWKLLIAQNQTILRNFRQWNGEVVL